MKKIILFVIVLVVIIFALAGVLIFVKNPKEDIKFFGIQVISPSANAEVSSPLKITGVVDGSNNWVGFEGQVGTVRLLDNSGNELGLAILTATGDWMQLPTNFSTELVYSSGIDQDGSLVFRNENASGEPSRDKTFVLPVKIKKSAVAQETMTVKAFFSNNNFDPQISCNKTFPVSRVVTKTTAVARVALVELLKGPSQADTVSGFYTSINSGVEIKSLNIDSAGTARVDFSEAIEQGVGGSCKVSAIRAQITETLKQFPTVKNVIISVNGRTEDILQP